MTTVKRKGKETDGKILEYQEFIDSDNLLFAGLKWRGKVVDGMGVRELIILFNAWISVQI
jgi:hypothetical protein